MRTFIKIENPCKVPWEEIQDVGMDKFCASCSKKVLDLSSKSDSEIMKTILEHKGEKFCGRVFKHQLRNDIIVNNTIANRQISNNHLPKFALALMMLSGFANNFTAQTIPQQKIEKTSNNNSSKEKEKEKTNDDFITIKGKIIDKNSNKTISDAFVKLITIAKIFETKTDANGNFALEIPKTQLRNKNLLNIITTNKFPNSELITFNKEELSKSVSIKINPESELANMYGEISTIYAGEKSIVYINGKKFDYKIFNKSFMIYGSKYELYYIPKEYISAFTTQPEIEDIFISFLK